jgi:hypothetical protein
MSDSTHEPTQDLEYFRTTDTVHIVTMNNEGHEVVTPIWAVVAHGHAYIRSGYGQESKWFARVARAHAAEFVDGDRRIPVTAESVIDGDILDWVDEAYREKYASTPEPLEMILAAGPRGDTLRVAPQAPREPATGAIEHI